MVLILQISEHRVDWYAVLLTNERGTGGYGEKFAKTARAVFYGQREYQDIMEAVDYVEEKYPIDAERLNVMGYSRGGFLTNWIITHTDRFNSAITAGGFSDVYSFFSTGDYMHVWCEKNYEGTPWDDEDITSLRKLSEGGQWLLLLETPFEVELPWNLLKEVNPIEVVRLINQ